MNYSIHATYNTIKSVDVHDTRIRMRLSRETRQKRDELPRDWLCTRTHSAYSELWLKRHFWNRFLSPHYWKQTLRTVKHLGLSRSTGRQKYRRNACLWNETPWICCHHSIIDFSCHSHLITSYWALSLVRCLVEVLWVSVLMKVTVFFSLSFSVMQPHSPSTCACNISHCRFAVCISVYFIPATWVTYWNTEFCQWNMHLFFF